MPISRVEQQNLTRMAMGQKINRLANMSFLYNTKKLYQKIALNTILQAIKLVIRPTYFITIAERKLHLSQIERFAGIMMFGLH
ncbi:hypothetical protein FACS1894127_0920 [Clostridia bacterium]|nr:hypothetical protein FACS1894127_0920 [Clostridia bacterium]